MGIEKPYINGKKRSVPNRYVVHCHTTVPKDQHSRFGPYKKGEFLGSMSLKTKNVNNASIFYRDGEHVGWFDTWDDGACMGDYFEPLPVSIILEHDDSDKH